MRPGRKKREASPYVDQAARLSARLRVLREQAELTQIQLAMRAEVSESTIRKIEQGKVTNPGFFLVMALLKALDAAPSALD